MNLATKIKLLVGGTVLAGSIAGGAITCYEFSSANDHLKTDPSYIVACDIKAASYSVGNAEFNMDYHRGGASMVSVPQGRPEMYPNGAIARDYIEKALNELMKHSKKDERIEPLITELIVLYNAIPNRDNLHYYNGSSVDSSTFKNERAKLDSIEGKVENIYSSFIDNGPDEIISQMATNRFLCVVFSFVALGAFCYELAIMKI